MTILFDENISHHLAEFLKRMGAPGDVQHVRRVSWSGWPDDQWIPLAIRNEWIVLTADRNDRTRALAVRDLKALKGRFIFLGPFWDDLRIWEKAKWLVGKWDHIVEQGSAMPPGTCLLIDRSGRTSSL